MKKAILVVSFGTSYEETRKKTIDCIEQEIQAAYPEYQVYRAWTSKMIMKKLKTRDGIHIMNVREAMEQMEKDGIEEVIVQPTHVMNGYENDMMTEDAKAYSSHFSRVAIGAPLLTSMEDQTRIIKAVAENLPVEKDEALILMGHGTEHFANSIYAALDYQFKDMGYPNIFVGTVEGYPELENVKKLLKKAGLKKIALAPFMIVAADHSKPYLCKTPYIQFLSLHLLKEDPHTGRACKDNPVKCVHSIQCLCKCPAFSCFRPDRRNLHDLRTEFSEPE